MKQKLFLISSILPLLLVGLKGARSQWIETTGPSGVICFTASGGKIFAGTQTKGVFLSTDNGMTWKQDGLDSDWVETIVALGGNSSSPGMIFAGTGTGLFVSNDNGTNWTADTAGLGGLTDIYSLAVSMGARGNVGEEGQPNLIAGTAAGIFVSTDRGGSWKQTVKDSFANPIVADGSNVFAIAIGSQKFYYSSDQGISWTVTGHWPGFTYSMAVVDGDIFAAESTGQGIAQSTDHGATWAFVDSGLDIFYRLNIHVLATSGENLFFGADYGIFMTSNKGVSWEDATDSTYMLDDYDHELDVNALLVFNGNLYAGADDSIWYRPLSQIIGNSAVQLTQPPKSTLSSYPNPFSKLATIGFTTQESGSVQVIIVNILGTEVKSIFSGELEAGEHEFSWDASGMAPGMYECVVRMNGQMQEIPMMLTRN